MAQQQQNLHVAAPAFKGLNSQDSTVGLGMEWARYADQCVIDELGRIACRKGFNSQTTNPATALGGEVIRSAYIFTDNNGTQWPLFAGNNKLFRWSGGVLQELTLPDTRLGSNPGDDPYPGITDDNWQFAQLQGECFIVQAGHVPLKATRDSLIADELLYWDEEPKQLANFAGIGNPNAITTGYGRVFCGDFDADNSLVTWSNLLNGDGYTIDTDVDSDSGFYDLDAYWPYGHDEMVAVRVHNNFLIVWGKESILLYNIPDNGPVFGTLADTIEGIGCAGRDTVVPIGQDIFYLDYTGVRSLSRTIQEKSVPIGDVSRNVRDEVVAEIQGTDEREISAVYDAENSLYCVFFPEGDISRTYVFDTRTKLEDGSHRATRWPDINIHCAAARPDGIVFYGGRYGVYLYEDYNDIVQTVDDDGNPETSERTVLPIPMVYQTHWQTWDQPVNLKFPKQVDVTVIGGQEFQFCLSWEYDYNGISTIFGDKICREISRGDLWQYNIDEYGMAEYSGALGTLSREQFNVWGNGHNVAYQLRADVSGSRLSLQEINIQTLFGRII